MTTMNQYIPPQRKSGARLQRSLILLSSKSKVSGTVLIGGLGPNCTVNSFKVEKTAQGSNLVPSTFVSLEPVSAKLIFQEHIE